MTEYTPEQTLTWIKDQLANYFRNSWRVSNVEIAVKFDDNAEDIQVHIKYLLTGTEVKEITWQFICQAGSDDDWFTFVEESTNAIITIPFPPDFE